MDDDLMKLEDQLQGLYMIFVKTDTEISMGQVIGLTQTAAQILPWNFMWGGIDEEKYIEIILAEQKEFFSFDNMKAMDLYFAVNFWQKHLDKNIQRGTIL